MVNFYNSNNTTFVSIFSLLKIAKKQLKVAMMVDDMISQNLKYKSFVWFVVVDKSFLLHSSIHELMAGCDRTGVERISFVQQVSKNRTGLDTTKHTSVGTILPS